MLIRPGWERSIKSCGLEEWMWCEGNISWERDKKGNVERIVPLYDHFNKLSKQSEAFLAGANNFVEDGGDHDEVEDTMVQGRLLPLLLMRFSV
jgi:baculoviral IAP repeat-containing protein 6